MEDVKSEPHCSLSSVLSAASWCVSEFCVTGTVTLSLYRTSQALPFSHIAGKTPPPPPGQRTGLAGVGSGTQPAGAPGLPGSVSVISVPSFLIPAADKNVKHKLRPRVAFPNACPCCHLGLAARSLCLQVTPSGFLRRSLTTLYPVFAFPESARQQRPVLRRFANLLPRRDRPSLAHGRMPGTRDGRAERLTDSARDQGRIPTASYQVLILRRL